MTPIEIINSFVAEKLDGNIQRLANFPLGSLRNDKVYGCPGRNFDSDDTELMRAIYCVVFGDTWENISIDNLAMAGCVVIRSILITRCFLRLGKKGSQSFGILMTN